jgi:acetyl-CoA acyltransferase
VLIDVVRTAAGRGKPGGALAGVHPTDLLAGVLRHLIARANIDPELIEDVLAGCVLQASDQAGNIARNAVLGAGFPATVPGTTIDRQCGSSQQAVHFAAQGVAAGAYDVVIAAGVESMSRVPMGTNRMGANQLGEMAQKYWPAGLVHQGVSAELVAARWGLTRQNLDEYSAQSHQRAASARAEGAFESEIVPVKLPVGDHLDDQTIRPATSVESLSELRPAFRSDGMAARFPEVQWVVTPGNSSPLTDGASAALIMSEEKATQLGLTPRARFVSFAVIGDDPILMLTGPIPATRTVLTRANLSLDDVDVYEVNEAFASVPLAWASELHADPAKLNPRGGAIALGHAMGSSGTRLLCTLVNQLEATGGRYGLQAMCEGGGMANAMIVERL